MSELKDRVFENTQLEEQRMTKKEECLQEL
jgi:hypothetical protein